MFDRTVYFDSVRGSLFSGSMNQGQVNGQNGLLDHAEAVVAEDLAWVVKDMRFLAYMLATTYHECDRTMLPIEEYGKGSGMSYGKQDPETGQTYYGRGFVMITWRDNYARATSRLGLSKTPDDLEWHAERALDPTIAADILFQGMTEGWFTGKKLSDYFDQDSNDAVNARAIINNDVSKMGKTIAGYHGKFLAALQAAWIAEPAPAPEVAEWLDIQLRRSSKNVQVSITLDGEVILARSI